ncbi:hypothetical protein CUT44_05230 [Streptomyces carminius]|uniref:Pyridine nucleotide-disulfide oxidoreductase n=1 Tax=Streptomyces carminius TaxID=2665496 RepID=A0A2M8M558_9ACTN|nr:hypothetical protein [Streptomyces carminius]PJE99352.1 hypothetical protein CUT44_05230 [Streptomyces carminius]
MPSTITAEHVRELLSSTDPDPRLVLLAGRARVVPAAETDTDRYRGAVEIVSRDELTARLGSRGQDGPEPSDRELTELAARLEAVVTGLGA